MKPPGLVLVPGKPPVNPVVVPIVEDPVFGNMGCTCPVGVGRITAPVEVEPVVVDPGPKDPVLLDAPVVVELDDDVVPVVGVMIVVVPEVTPAVVDEPPLDVASGQVHGQNQAAWFG